tara:strand:- start:279 stop:725 length:447 start_codon:yes stop_codon:yes gene_type:complete
MSLPFELRNRHKYLTRKNWEKRNIEFRDDGHFNYVYNEYIHATNCELCNKLFSNSRDRHLDHNHITGQVRHIVCLKCNHHKKDRKIRLDNTSGEKCISKRNDKCYNSGYCYEINITRNNKVLGTKRKTLEEAIICRDEFIKKHPVIFT